MNFLEIVLCCGAIVLLKHYTTRSACMYVCHIITSCHVHTYVCVYVCMDIHVIVVFNCWHRCWVTPLAFRCFELSSARGKDVESKGATFSLEQAIETTDRRTRVGGTSGLE